MAYFGHFAIILVVALIATQGLNLRPYNKKSESLRPFREANLIRDAIEFIGESVSSAFSPMESNLNIDNSAASIQFKPTMERYGTISKIRKLKRRNQNGWHAKDIAKSFETKYLHPLEAPHSNNQASVAVAFASIAAPKSVPYTQQQLNYEDAWISKAIIQVFSPMDQKINSNQKAMLPFRKQMTISKLAKMLKRAS